MPTATAYYASLLRNQLRERNLAYAAKYLLPHQLSYGEAPVVCYEPDRRTHGNFMPETYAAILSHPQWARRLRKVHTSARSSLPRNDRGFWAELDSCNSSDALLMNIFCFPGVFDDRRVSAMLGVEPADHSEFGFRARVPLASGLSDRTEVDLRLGDLLVEAKLTESDFQSREREIVENYRDFREVFDVRQLPRANRRYHGYQLIRNVLAAHALGCSFCVLHDARRPDLREAWYDIMRSVRLVDLRLRCKVLTWQELATVLPNRLRKFLEEKYGIEPVNLAI